VHCLLAREGLEFKRDPKYLAKFQVGNDVDANNRLDRGHSARRADLLWGTREEAEQADVDSFFFTNITSQLDDFNQSDKHGLWGEHEIAIYEGVRVDELRLSVLGGPLFKDTDLPYRKVLVPRSFRKRIAYGEGGVLKAKAYVLTQDNLEDELESLGLEPFKLYQGGIAPLTQLSGLDYGPLKAADIADAEGDRLVGRRIVDGRALNGEFVNQLMSPDGVDLKPSRVVAPSFCLAPHGWSQQRQRIGSQASWSNLDASATKCSASGPARRGRDSVQPMLLLAGRLA
jgi:hypothetical protein